MFLRLQEKMKDVLLGTTLIIFGTNVIEKDHIILAKIYIKVMVFFLVEMKNRQLNLYLIWILFFLCFRFDTSPGITPQQSAIISKPPMINKNKVVYASAPVLNKPKVCL